LGFRPEPEAFPVGRGFASLYVLTFSGVPRVTLEEPKCRYGDSDMSFEDKTIVCEDCGEQFVHSADDQALYAERGFSSDPKRCRNCREKRKAARSSGGGGGGGGYGRGRPQGGGGRDRRGGGGGGGRPRESYQAVCAACGISTTVPFKPTQDRPVYCRDCYRSLRR
jgi:CxxC-x17-CxxC domain-containing protein